MLGARRFQRLSPTLPTQGFSLPLALGFGLIILIVAQTMILRAYQQRVSTLSRTATNDALAVAEIGVTRYQALLNRYRDLAVYNACLPLLPNQPCQPDTWRQAPQSLVSKICPGSAPAIQNQILQGIASEDTRAWQAVDTNDPSQGEFRLVRYRVNPTRTEGQLTVEGRLLQKVAASQVAAETRARLQVTIPVTPSQLGQPAIYPGLWLATLDLQPPPPEPILSTDLPSPPAPRLAVQSNVLVNDCGVDVKAISPNPPLSVASNAALQTQIPMPTLPSLPQVNQPNKNGGLPRPELPIVYSLGTLRRGINLPRTQDLPSSNGVTQVYRYVIDALVLPTNSRVRVDADNQRQALRTSVEVELYIRGALGTLTRIEHDCKTAEGCQPTDLKVFAYQNATAANADGSYPEFCLGAGQKFQGFLFAPGYQVGLGDRAEFTGTLWARAWNFKCATAPETARFTQSGNWGSRQVMLPPQVQGIRAWQRVSVESQ